MLKGISRQIVEITQTENPYFERVFLVVRASCGEVPAHQLDAAAQKFLQQQSPHTGIRRARRKQRLLRVALLATGGGIGAALALAICMIV